MKLLIVSLSYPPLNNPQSIRWKNLSELLAKQGINLDIISLKLPFTNTKVKENKISIRRLYSPITSFLLKNFLLSGDKVKKSHLKKWLLRFYEFFSLGDAYIDWGIRVSYELKRLSPYYDRIILSCEPHVATFLPVFFIDSDKIILDLADPPISNYFLNISFFPFKQLHEAIFRLALRKANKVVFTGYGVKEFYEKKFPFLKGKSFVVTQGFPKDFYNYSLSISNFNSPPVFSFVGNFIKNIREPITLVKVLSKFNVKFAYVGKEDAWSDYCRKILKSKFIFLGRMPHEKALKAQLKSDVLVYLGNKVPYQQSGKIYEYIGSNKPILAIVQNETDDAIKLIEQIKCGLVCRNNETEIFVSIKKILLKLREKKDIIRKHNRLKLNYCWDALAEKYKSIIEE